MLMILSPAKTFELDINNEPIKEGRNLVFPNETRELISILEGYSVDELSKLMKISEKLAILNYDRYRDFYKTDTKAYTAILAFKGEAYRGMEAEVFSKEDLEYADEVLRILSGLYGVICPLDRIKEYRLEMGIKLPNHKGKDLYTYWDNKITDKICKSIENSPGEKVLINLASKEYSSALNVDKIRKEYNIVDISFLENRNGEFKTIGTYAKKARGMMSRYVIQNRINTIEEVKKFNESGYSYNEIYSSDSNIVFTR